MLRKSSPEVRPNFGTHADITGENVVLCVYVCMYICMFVCRGRGSYHIFRKYISYSDYFYMDYFMNEGFS